MKGILFFLILITQQTRLRRQNEGLIVAFKGMCSQAANVLNFAVILKSAISEAVRLPSACKGPLILAR